MHRNGPFMKRTRNNHSAGLSRRLSFPEDERRLPWLSMLLDSYAIADTGVAVAIRDEEKRRKTRLACGKGCGSCCVQQRDLPVYPHELAGIYWYVAEKIDPALRVILRERFAEHTIDGPCPFLIDGSCSIHPLRPIGCRQFNVFTRPCDPGEDPYFTRKTDVLVPLPDYTDRAFAAVLAFYGLDKERDVERAVKQVKAQIRNLKVHDWKSFRTSGG